MTRTVRPLGYGEHELLENGERIATFYFNRSRDKTGIECTGWIKDLRGEIIRHSRDGRGWWAYFADMKRDLINRGITEGA